MEALRRALRYIRFVYRTTKKPLEVLETWRKRRRKQRLPRTRALQKWARQKQEAARTRKSALKWKAIRFRYRRKVLWLEAHKDSPLLDAGRFETWMLNGDPGNISAGVKAAIVRAVARGLFVTDTYGSRSHTSTSWHYPWNNSDGKGHAVDLAGSFSAMVEYQNAELRRGEDLLELIGPDNDACAKHGSRFTLSEGSSLETAHDNHVHRATNG